MSESPAPAGTPSVVLDGMTPLPGLGVIQAEGADAARFLHGQLTQDFALLGEGQARLAAFCSAKGRMQASFIGVKAGTDRILLVCSRDLLAPTLKRLSMFVLRSQVRLSDASADWAIAGLAGNTARLPCLPEAPWAVLRQGDGLAVRLYPADTHPRALWLAPAGAAAPQAPALDPALWAWSEVRSGVATLSQPVVDAFVPQMLNYESLGGVNFKKGCYPGQEVVARSQFRGTLKRRAWIVHGDGPLQAGQEVFSAADPEQPCGLVVQTAPAPTWGWDAIVSIQISAAEDGRLQAGAPGGPSLARLPLPYPLLDDI